MSSSTRPPRPSVPVRFPGRGLLRRGPARWVLLASLAIALAGAGLYGLWQQVGPRVTGHPRYQIDIATIEITPPPDWVPQDVRTRALGEAGLTGTVSLFDPELAERIGKAFQLHPWVRDVRVTKRPTGLRAELEYRVPVLRVDLPAGYELVDIDSVRLPKDSPQLSRFASLPRLARVSAGPPGPSGTVWSNSRVAGAARIAAALRADWTALGLARIEAAPRKFQAESSETELYYLFTPSGQTRIIWGSSENTAEPPAAEKVARLKAYLSEHRSFDSPNQPHDIDLRPAASLLVTPRMARQD